MLKTIHAQKVLKRWSNLCRLRESKIRDQRHRESGERCASTWREDQLDSETTTKYSFLHPSVKIGGNGRIAGSTGLNHSSIKVTWKTVMMTFWRSYFLFFSPNKGVKPIFNTSCSVYPRAAQHVRWETAGLCPNPSPYHTYTHSHTPTHTQALTSLLSLCLGAKQMSLQMEEGWAAQSSLTKLQQRPHRRLHFPSPSSHQQSKSEATEGLQLKPATGSSSKSSSSSAEPFLC